MDPTLLLSTAHRDKLSQLRVHKRGRQGEGGGGGHCGLPALPACTSAATEATGEAQGRCIGKQRENHWQKGKQERQATSRTAKAEVQAGVGVGVPTHEGKGRHGSMDGGPPEHVQPGRGALPEVCQVASQAG